MFTAPHVLRTLDSWMHRQNRPVAGIARVCEGWHSPCTAPLGERCAVRASDESSWGTARYQVQHHT